MFYFHFCFVFVLLESVAQTDTLASSNSCNHFNASSRISRVHYCQESRVQWSFCISKYSKHIFFSSVTIKSTRPWRQILLAWCLHGEVRGRSGSATVQHSSSWRQLCDDRSLLQQLFKICMCCFFLKSCTPPCYILLLCALIKINSKIYFVSEASCW